MTGRGTDSLSEWAAGAAREMQHEDDVHATLDRAVHLALTNVEGCDSASISIVRARRLVETHAATSQLARDGDRLQYETGEGPCLDAIWEHRSVHSPDLGEDPRWPTWGPRVVAETGALSILAFRMFTTSDTLGALNLYSRTGFDDSDEDTGMALAAHAAIALSAAEETAHLAAALDTRTVIGQATGILMERFSVDARVAFSVLARLSQETNTRLHDIAVSIVSTGAVPTVPTVPRRH